MNLPMPFLMTICVGLLIFCAKPMAYWKACWDYMRLLFNLTFL